MAEALFREMTRERGDYTVGSAGVSAMKGQPASRHTADILREKGIEFTAFRSRSLTHELMDKATHIFAMARHHIEAIEMDFPEAADKTYLVSEFCSDDALRNSDVNDPFGGPRAEYDETHDLLSKMLPSVLAFIDQTFPKPNS